MIDVNLAEELFGKKILLIDNEDKEWVGILDCITSDADNEEDDTPGEYSVTLEVGKRYYEFFDHEVKSIQAAE